jgi:hypothetical protein
MTRILVAPVLAAATVFVGGLCWQFLKGESAPEAGLATGAAASLAFVGSEICGGFHEAEAKLWRSSHHKLAIVSLK